MDDKGLRSTSATTGVSTTDMMSIAQIGDLKKPGGSSECLCCGERWVPLAINEQLKLDGEKIYRGKKILPPAVARKHARNMVNTLVCGPLSSTGVGIVGDNKGKSIPFHQVVFPFRFSRSQQKFVKS
jgi:hypothetical protein